MLLEEEFTVDIATIFSYPEGSMPIPVFQACMNVSNYLRRIDTWFRARGYFNGIDYLIVDNSLKDCYIFTEGLDIFNKNLPVKYGDVLKHTVFCHTQDLRGDDIFIKLKVVDSCKLS